MRKQPPLWVWVACSGLILFGVTYLQLTSSERTQLLRQPYYATFMHQMENALDNYRADSSQCKVICWGSSLSCQAIDHSDVLHEQIAVYDLDVAVQKMYLLNANAKTFPYLHELFEITEQLKPKLICIEDHLFSHADRNIQEFKFMKEINHYFASWAGETPKTKILPVFRDKTFDTFHRKLEKPQLRDTNDYTLHKRSILSFSDNKVLNQQLDFILEQQIPIVVLNVPRVANVERYMITPQKQAAINQLILEYREAGFQIEYWKFPSYLPFKYYSDYAHMNKLGRAIFSQWLSQKIAEKLANECYK